MPKSFYKSKKFGITIWLKSAISARYTHGPIVYTAGTLRSLTSNRASKINNRLFIFEREKEGSFAYRDCTPFGYNASPKFAFYLERS